MKIIRTEPTVGVVRLPHADGLALPGYETAGAAGMDLRAAVPEDRPLLILPGKRALVPTGLVLEIPEGMEGQVRPRSGLAMKHGVTCLNTPGTIDSDYRGEVKVLLVNLGEDDFYVTRGMRIAQVVFATVVRMAIEERGAASSTARGAGGFGSTGTG
jgi:dUTP pyrophosphatase